jgi:tRNA pseudouridine65 synthase
MANRARTDSHTRGTPRVSLYARLNEDKIVSPVSPSLGAPAPVELPILFRDEHLVAIHKPAGLLVHRTSLDAHEALFAVQLLRRQLKRRIFTVHRLDKATSGVLVFGLSKDAAGLLSRAFERGEVEKTYLALVRGWIAETGDIDHPLSRRFDEAELHATQRNGAPQEARTLLRRLGTAELPHRVDRYPTSRYSLVELRPLTGRRHQLRRHMSHLSHHIVGDTTYGKGRHNQLFRDLFDSHRLLLASVELDLPHPLAGGRLQLTAPLDQGFLSVLERLGLLMALPDRWRTASGPGTVVRR